MTFTTEIFGQFGTTWALLTAGTEERFNPMTISWGGLGTLWGRDVATVYVRPSRYTHEFLDANEYFTISFFPEKYRQVLAELGSRSGRDMDKMKASGLTPKKVGETMTFEEADVTFVCRKIYKQGMVTANMPADVARQIYETEPPHDIYIGEVVEIYE